MSLTREEIQKQSESAYNQWCVQWRDHAKKHSKFPQKSFDDFLGIGAGKYCLLIANGASFEREIETIKQYQDNVDIMVCDKSLGHALENGIKPTYCLVCDANVSYEKYLEKYKDQVKDTVLFINVCANPDWSHKAEWKDIYFFANEDILQSEKEFMALSGCKNKIPAATNVSNCMVVILTQSNNQAKNNFFGYSKYLLIGFDYSWKFDGNYYAFNKDGNGKANYMRHVYCMDAAGEHCYTSTNLLFSSRWLKDYISAFNLPIVLCSRDSIFLPPNISKLEEQMKIKTKCKGQLVHSKLMEKQSLINKLQQIDSTLNEVARKEQFEFLRTV